MTTDGTYDDDARRQAKAFLRERELAMPIIGARGRLVAALAAPSAAVGSAGREDRGRHARGSAAVSTAATASASPVAR